MRRDDARAALILGLLVAAGVIARWLLAPPAGAPGDVHVSADVRSSLDSNRSASERMARPLASNERVDFDVANATELMRLPGIGPVLAARIVADRKEHGPFRKMETLDRVRGIGPKLLESLRPHAAFSGVPAGPKSLDTQ